MTTATERPDLLPGQTPKDKLFKGAVPTISIVGRKWFEKTNGNTYHSVEMWVNGDFVGKVSFEYGYGSQWIYTAETYLMEKGYIDPEQYSNGGCQPLWSYCRDNGIKLMESVTDVSRKKDL